MKLACFIALAVFFAGTSHAQLKSQIEREASVSQSMLRPLGAQSLLGFFDPNKFSMRQSFSMSYLSSSGSGLSLASYTNSMAYQLADPLNVRFDVTLQGQPFGGGSGIYSGNSFSKLFISRAEMNYRPSENTFITFRFSQSPYNQWMNSDPFRYNRSSFMSSDMSTGLMFGDE